MKIEDFKNKILEEIKNKKIGVVKYEIRNSRSSKCREKVHCLIG